MELSRIRTCIHVTPFFGREALRGPEYTEKTMIEVSRYFNLNKYSDKETFELLKTDFVGRS